MVRGFATAGQPYERSPADGQPWRSAILRCDEKPIGRKLGLQAYAWGAIKAAALPRWTVTGARGTGQMLLRQALQHLPRIKGHLLITLHPHPDASSLLNLKTQYLRSIVAPMDGMWELGLINPSPHWEIKLGGEQAGYYAANDKGDLLQFFVRPTFEQHAQALFDHIVAQETLKQAVVSTIDPFYLSLCLDVQKKVTVHTYLYECGAEIRPSAPKTEKDSDLRLIDPPELDHAISFQQACLGGTADLTWLRGYSANLIERKELFVLYRNDEWLALGECRRSDSQEGVADLGMMVSPAHRQTGWATHVLTRLRAHCTEQGLHAICSTTVENIAAQKAIVRSGFISRHRIITVAL